MTLRINRSGIIVAAPSAGGALPTGSVVQVSTVGMSYCGIAVVGTWVGTILLEQTFDGTNWVSAPMYLQGSTNTAAVPSLVSTTGTNLTGFWAIPVPSPNPVATMSSPPVAIRGRCTVFTSGSPLVTLAASDDNSYIQASILPASIHQSTASGANASITAFAPSSTVHAWACTHAECDFSATATAPALTIYDGTAAAGTVLLKEVLPVTAAIPNVITLPKTPDNPNGAIVGTVGKQMTVAVNALGGSVVTNLNVTFVPA